VVATPDGDVPYWDCDYRGEVAIVVGSERNGVGARWLDVADARVAIPMAGAADSLNVAVAAGIVLFEAARRRCTPALARD
jgi:tRNA G18 (ribose-2'-O)-methylase SpoU